MNRFDYDARERALRRQEADRFYAGLFQFLACWFAGLVLAALALKHLFS